MIRRSISQHLFVGIEVSSVVIRGRMSGEIALLVPGLRACDRFDNAGAILPKPTSRRSFRFGERSEPPAFALLSAPAHARRDVVTRAGGQILSNQRIAVPVQRLFFAQQTALYTSWMDLGAEALLDPFHQIPQSNGRFLLGRLADEYEDHVGELVCLLRTTFVGARPGKTVSLEGRSCLIERQP